MRACSPPARTRSSGPTSASATAKTAPGFPRAPRWSPTTASAAAPTVPPIGTLTTILRPQPGLSAIRNPVAPGGGADPDPPEQIRRYAPRSVLTFGRAVSGDDYETIAAQTPGVRRARAVLGMGR